MVNTETIMITPEFLNLIAEIEEFKGAWRALGSLAPERLSALRGIATVESVGSSTRIEGSRLTDREVERLLGNLNIASFANRDEQEVAGYASVMELVFSSWQDITLTENHVRQLHRDLFAFSEGDDWHRGRYKTSSNSVTAFDDQGRQVGVVFETASPFVLALVQNFMGGFMEEGDELLRGGEGARYGNPFARGHPMHPERQQTFLKGDSSLYSGQLCHQVQGSKSPSR